MTTSALAPAHLDKTHEPVSGKILDTAVARARAIERMLAQGTLTVPYPASILAELHECSRVFNDYCTTPERLKELAGRLDQPDLPW